MDPKLKKNILAILKILVSLGLLVWVLKQMNWDQIRLTFQTHNPLYFGLGVIFFILSQLVSVVRFNLFLRKTGIRISFLANTKLYLLGMFYNFFIPGGIGGDAYKAFTLSKTFGKPLKSLGQVVFVDRFLGLVAIGFLVCVIAFFIPIPIQPYIKWILILIGIFIIVFILKFTIKLFHSHRKRVYLGFLYSIGVQILQLLSVWCILKSFSIEENPVIYLFMFLISSILSVISFAGVGVREAVFYYGGVWFKFNPDVSASVAISFSLITAIISFFGIFFQLRKINLKK